MIHSLMTSCLRTSCLFGIGGLLVAVLIVIIDTKLGLGATWASELSTFLLSWTVMLGGALAYGEQSHLGLDLLTRKFDPSTQRAAERMAHLLVLCFALIVMIYGGSRVVIARFEMQQLLPAMGISKAWFYLSLPLSGLCIAVTALNALFREQPHKPT